MKSITMIEFRSIARGIETTDMMVKASNISILRSATVCPGKYLVLVGGDTGSVKEALNVGKNHGTPYIVSQTSIPNIDSQVLRAIEGYSQAELGKAVAVLEYYAIIDAIIGADVAVKTANVRILEMRLGFAIGGKGFFILTGEISEIEHAVKIAKLHSQESGMLLETSIIQNITPELLKHLM